MMKLCLTIIILNAIFSAQNQHLSIEKNDVYGLTLMKCQKITQTLSEKYGNNPENSDFDWQQINKIFLVRFFQASTEQNLTSTLHTLLLTSNFIDQQIITSFLTNFDRYRTTWKIQKIDHYEIREFFHLFVKIEELVFERGHILSKILNTFK